MQPGAGRPGRVRAALLPLLLLPRGGLAEDARHARHWQARFLEEYPLAICNDGSPAAYYYRAGRHDSRRWLVYLEGGMWCWDTSSCRPGKHGISSSKSFPRTPRDVNWWAKRLKGVFDMTGSPLGDGNVAFVRHCSNDGFMGDTSPEQYPLSLRRGRWQLKFHFRGRRIIDAVFADLRRRGGLGKQGDLVVYGGCSAGGRGALVSLDYVASSLVGKARVVGLFDSAFWVPILPFGPTVVSFENQTFAVTSLFNATGLISEECERQYPGELRWKCLFPAFRLPFIRTPYLLSHSQYDKFAINWNLRRYLWLPKGKLNQTVRKWAEQYRQQVVNYLPSPAPGSRAAVFSSACYYHCTTMSNFVHWVRVGGSTLLETLERWLVKPTEVAWLRDDCKGFDCTAPGGFIDLVPAVMEI